MKTDILQGQEKIVVWIANIINPLLAGFLFYYMWKTTFPNKAKQSNTISFTVAFVEICMYVAYKLFGMK